MQCVYPCASDDQRRKRLILINATNENRMKILPILSLSGLLMACACVPAQAAWSPTFGLNVGTGLLGTMSVDNYQGQTGAHHHSVGSFFHHVSWGGSVGMNHWTYYSNWHYGAQWIYQNNGQDVTSGNLLSSFYTGPLATMDYTFHSNWNFIAKGGLVFVHQHINNGRGIERTKNTVRPLFSAGIGYNLETNMEANIMFNHLMGSSSNYHWGDNNAMSQNTVTLGIRYTF